jgi:hypothetical protein
MQEMNSLWIRNLLLEWVSIVDFLHVMISELIKILEFLTKMVEMPTDDPGEKSSKFVKAQIWDTGMSITNLYCR